MSSDNIDVTSSLILFPDEEHVWVRGEVIKVISKTRYEIKVHDDDCYLYANGTSPNFTVTVDSKPAADAFSPVFPPQNLDVEETGADDMSMLGFLHEANIIQNIRLRHRRQIPYTYTGDICIAVNPYKWLPLYNAEMMASYFQHQKTDMPPHIYSVSSAAFKGIRDEHRNQSILISGESGAGKTETAKILMTHVASMAGYDNFSVEKITPLLESFGNAKTVRNNNSSRFGKFMRMMFDSSLHLLGSECSVFLLEKSRVVAQNDGEGNYHIFHQLLNSPTEFKLSLGLNRTQQSYQYTSACELQSSYKGSSVGLDESMAGGERFAFSMEVLKLLGLSDDTIRQLMGMLAGILHCGQLKFHENVENGCVSLKMQEKEVEHSVQHCCALFRVDQQSFSTNLTVRAIEVNGEQMSTNLTASQCVEVRDAMCKDIYQKIFEWLVMEVNRYTRPAKATSNEKEIAILDIFGFESLQTNGFEQLCINFANEKLQKVFTDDLFKATQDEYKADGIPWTSVEYVDNDDVLTLIEGNNGIISVLNAQCIIMNGSDKKFLSSVAGLNHPKLIMKSRYPESFTIAHYVGDIMYDSEGFVERNKDVVMPECQQMLSKSSNQLLAEIFSGPNLPQTINVEEKSSGSGKPPRISRRKSFINAVTLSTQFKNQLKSLMEIIQSMNIRYVRCIKPNDYKSATMFDSQRVMEQLRAAGVIAAIKISRQTYPFRLQLNEFYRRYRWILSLRKDKDNNDKKAPKPADSAGLLRDCCRRVMDTIGKKSNKSSHSENIIAANKVQVVVSNSGYAIGVSRVYFTLPLFNCLQHELHVHRVQCICKIQKAYRVMVCLRYLRRRIQSRVVIQSIFRMRLARSLRARLVSWICVIQREIRCFLHKCRLQQLCARNIQRIVRGIRPRRRFIVLRKEAVRLQAWVRCRLECARFAVLILEHREQKKLENQVVRLKQLLEEEVARRLLLESKCAEQQLCIEQFRQMLGGAMQDQRRTKPGVVHVEAEVNTESFELFAPGLLLVDKSNACTMTDGPHLEEVSHFISVDTSRSLLHSYSNHDVPTTPKQSESTAMLTISTTLGPQREELTIEAPPSPQLGVQSALPSTVVSTTVSDQHVSRPPHSIQEPLTPRTPSEDNSRAAPPVATIVIPSPTQANFAYPDSRLVGSAEPDSITTLGRVCEEYRAKRSTVDETDRLALLRKAYSELFEVVNSVAELMSDALANSKSKVHKKKYLSAINRLMTVQELDQDMGLDDDLGFTDGSKSSGTPQQDNFYSTPSPVVINRVDSTSSISTGSPAPSKSGRSKSKSGRRRSRKYYDKLSVAFAASAKESLNRAPAQVDDDDTSDLDDTEDDSPFMYFGEDRAEEVSQEARLNKQDSNVSTKSNGIDSDSDDDFECFIQVETVRV